MGAVDDDPRLALLDEVPGVGRLALLNDDLAEAVLLLAERSGHEPPQVG